MERDSGAGGYGREDDGRADPEAGRGERAEALVVRRRTPGKAVRDKGVAEREREVGRVRSLRAEPLSGC